MNILGLVALAAIAGVAVALQGQFMGIMQQKMGVLESVFITYGSGGIIIILAMLVVFLTRGSKLSALREVPPYALTTGVLGLIIIGSITYVVPRIGLVAGFAVILLAQYTLAALIDQYGLFGATIRPLPLGRIAGLAVMALGVWLVVRSA